MPVFGAQSKTAPWQSGTWTPVDGLAIKSMTSSATINANMQAALSLFGIDKLALALLRGKSPVFNQQQQADSELQHELSDITIRELARYVTTALALCEQHNQQVLPNVLTGKVAPSIIYTRPLTQEAQQLIALSPRLREQVFSRLLPRFVVTTSTAPLIIDCPGLGGGHSLDLVGHHRLAWGQHTTYSSAA